MPKLLGPNLDETLPRLRQRERPFVPKGIGDEKRWIALFCLGPARCVAQSGRVLAGNSRDSARYVIGMQVHQRFYTSILGKPVEGEFALIFGVHLMIRSQQTPPESRHPCREVRYPPFRNNIVIADRVSNAANAAIKLVRVDPTNTTMYPLRPSPHLSRVVGDSSG